MLRILHLSDLHFHAGDPEDRDRALRALLHTLAEQARAGAPPDIVLVSGDLVEHASPEAYEVAGRFFDRLRKTAADLPRERLLVVPGNHDVDRAAGRRLQRTLISLGDAQDFFTLPEERALHRRKLQAFRAFVDDYFGAGWADRTFHLLSLGEGTVGVATLCSAWFSQDDEDRERLWLGEAVVSAAAEALSRADLRLALVHHGPDWLHPLERPSVVAALAAGFDVVCHGHLHSQRPPTASYKGTPLGDRLVLAAGCSHRSAQHPSRAFLLDADLAGNTATVTPLRYLSGGQGWEHEEALADLYGTPAAPLPFALRRRAPRSTRTPGPRPAPAPSQASQDEALLRRYLAALVTKAGEHPSLFKHPARDGSPPLPLDGLYIELPANAGAGTVGVHGLLQAHRWLVLRGETAAGKTATAWHLCGQLARHALGMPGEADTYGFIQGRPPLPLWLSVSHVPALKAGKVPRPPQARGAASETDLLAAAEAQITALLAQHEAVAPPAAPADTAAPGPAPPAGPPVRAGFAEHLVHHDVLLFLDGLDDLPAERQQEVLRGLASLLHKAPDLRLLLPLRERSTADPADVTRILARLPAPPAGAPVPEFATATLVPLRLNERTQLVDRWVQTVHSIPVGMTIDGSAAALTTLMRRIATSEQARALSQHPMLLTAMCWVSSMNSQQGQKGLPEQRAELYATCLGALVANEVRRTPHEVADLVDELAQRSEALQAFRVAQTLDERADVWPAVRPLLEDPPSYDALRFLAGLQARRSPEHASRLLRAMLSEAGARMVPGERAQLLGLAGQMLAEMHPYRPDPQVARKVQDDLGRVLDELNDRLQRAPLPARIAIADGLGRAGDPRLPLDLLEPAAAQKLWVELPKGPRLPALSIMRYPVTCAQFWHFVTSSGHEPAAEPGHKYGQPREVRAQWEKRAQAQPNHPATLCSWDDALALCRFLTQADWRYRYDLPTESEWERAVRQGATDNRFYPWGTTLEPSYCNTGRRVGKTTPVGVFPAGTAAGGSGCADLIGNVWQWCQSEHDDDPTFLDIGGEELFEAAGPQDQGEHVARGGSWNYLRAGAMRINLPGTRSEEVGVRLVRRSR